MFDADGLCGLDFNYNGILNKEVRKVFTDNRTVIINTNRMLGEHMQADLLQFDDQCIFVNLLQKAMAQGVVYLKERFDNLVCNFRCA